MKLHHRMSVINRNVMCGCACHLLLYLLIEQTSQNNREILKRLQGHVVLCVFADPNTPLIGLCNFVMPLRASSFQHDDLKTIVIVGNEGFLRREWESLCNLPNLYVRPVSGAYREYCMLLFATIISEIKLILYWFEVNA